MAELFGLLIMILGSAFIFTAGVGILRLPDVLCRAHAISKALTLGLSLILIVLFSLIGTYTSGIKVFLAVLFQFTTIPIATHIFTRYACDRLQH